MQRSFLLRHFSVLYFAFLFLCTSFVSSAQSTVTADVKYVRIDIGHMGLSCPNLGPRFEQKLKQVSGIQNLKVYQKGSYATFELPAQSTVSMDELKQIGTKLGYPVNDVVVTFSDKLPLKAEVKN
jgi:hypothetical protein